MRRGFGVLLVLGLFTASLWGQELSTIVYPTEEELEQALDAGEIDATQFIELRELIRFGIDSSNAYLLDIIPNLFYTGQFYQYESSLEKLQASPFVKYSRDRFPSVQIKFTYAQRLEDDSLYRHIESMRAQLSDHVSADIKLGKEYRTETRLLGRAITYQHKTRGLRTLVVGNYYARFGLGGVIGYHRPLVSSSETFTDETILFPDNTGYNGLFADGKINGRTMTGMVSVHRDSLYAVVTGGAVLGFSLNPRIPELIVAVTSLNNRTTDLAHSIATGSLFSTQTYTSGQISGEVMMQGEDDLYPGGLLITGTHRSSDISVFYRGWTYSDHFRDFTSGGASGQVRRADEIEELNFMFTDRHRGQEGATIRTATEIGKGRKLLANAAVASINSDTVDLQLLFGVTSPVGKQMDARLDYLATEKKRSVQSDATVHQVRLETSFRLGRFASRQYIATRWNENAGQVGIFFNSRYTLNDDSEIEAWFSGRGAALDDRDSGYAYMFIRTIHRIFSNAELSLKFSHRFKQHEQIEGQSTISGNLEMMW